MLANDRMIIIILSLANIILSGHYCNANVGQMQNRDDT